ncbi:hypothetical protein [Paramuribaculum intestinale]|nr:hypothetical protein [Paramuribaculum intestinale]
MSLSLLLLRQPLRLRITTFSPCCGGREGPRPVIDFRASGLRRRASGFS